MGEGKGEDWKMECCNGVGLLEWRANSKYSNGYNVNLMFRGSRCSALVQKNRSIEDGHGKRRMVWMKRD